MVARETAVEQDGVKALNSDRNALEKKAGLSVVSWNGRDLIIIIFLPRVV